MIKNDLIEALVRKNDFTYQEAKDVANTVIKTFCESIENRDSIFLRGFGTFKIVKREQRKGRDIGKGFIVNIPARNTVKFILSKELKNKLK